MEKNKRVGSREFKTFDYLWLTGYHALSTAIDSNKGSFYNLLTAELFFCLSIEAFLNHVGNIKVPEWKLIDKCLNPTNKIRFLNYKSAFPLDFKKRPFHSLIEMVKFRNLVVHGRTENDTFEDYVSDRDKFELPQTKLEKYISIRNAKIYSSDSENIMKIIYQAFFNEKLHLGSPESASWIIS